MDEKFRIPHRILVSKLVQCIAKIGEEMTILPLLEYLNEKDRSRLNFNMWAKEKINLNRCVRVLPHESVTNAFLVQKARLVSSPSPPQDPLAASPGALDRHAVDEKTGDSVDISQSREHGNSEHSADCMDRLGELIGNMMRDLTRNAWSGPNCPLVDPATRIGDTEEGIEIALHVPRGMELAEDESKRLGTTDKSVVALKLRKSLYGLEQAGRL
ncbi:unnamed protein product [Albugo candida]|uniref:Uncharacterized protein n=1 Tax=Albugo candida TaxID=65357 RepID=A0A024FTV5_9STRA|nr:unnamed protein product [Albugo candida]|eukprot:CCI10568.1 unnamed protein product [Albugo candida]